MQDMAMPVSNSCDNRFEAIEQITKDFPHTKVVVLSQTTEPFLAKAALQTSAKGYIYKLDLTSSIHLADTIKIIGCVAKLLAMRISAK